MVNFQPISKILLNRLLKKKYLKRFYDSLLKSKKEADKLQKKSRAVNRKKNK